MWPKRYSTTWRTTASRKELHRHCSAGYAGCRKAQSRTINRRWAISSLRQASRRPTCGKRDGTISTGPRPPDRLSGESNVDAVGTIMTSGKDQVSH